MTDFQKALQKLGGLEGYKKERLARAAKAAELPDARAFEIWYGRARRIEPHEQQAILSALVAKEIADERNEQHGFRLALAKMESRLNQMEAALVRAASAGDVETIASALGIIS